jgi:ribonuclease P/MRP protein subunit RPP40
LKPSDLCARAAKKANIVLGQLARGVTYRDKSTFIRLYKAFVLPHLSYAASAWSPYNKADKEVLEKVQRRAVMMVTNIRGSYEERLAVLKIRTLEERRTRGDMIETFKILTGKSVVSPETWFSLAKEKDGAVNTRATKGYLNLVQPPVPETDVRKYFFSHRVVPVWNSLPDHVKKAKTTNGFKASYDRFKGY